jgi:uncharacterized protein YcgL (UPF0745 family)
MTRQVIQKTTNGGFFMQISPTPESLSQKDLGLGIL